MKILCISDTPDPIVYSSHITERYGNVDFVISAGDLSLPYYEYIISTLNKPLFFVFGNHNLEHFHYFKKDGMEAAMEQPRFGSLPPYGGDYIDGKVTRDRKTGVLVAGLGGSNRYNNGAHQFTDKQMMRRILAMAPRLLYNKLRYGRYLDILVTHAAPYGINDDIDPCHVGFKSFLKFMKWFEPKYLLHGHVHMTDLNAARIKTYHKTKVINVYLNYTLEDSELGGKDNE
ncbi:metallophosphoesterase family protein [Parasphaerochaeta coccoides]|uniref:Metallophosphoesterase n=1 Tax=Parasphaerochaeta coccoides (strain ATCC BAA-1237 / DSM 17374 / SPN1) TaxID=760011 RepID=F4GJ16_PARC1|nr:metallophosphoesterase [Parasphaerochaeta coccoides]AEC01311.1 metallophosphoesterase [Parasphaerochaeta coccoides DSM 17374]